MSFRLTVIWSLLALPGLFWLGLWAGGQQSAIDLVPASGLLAGQLLLFALAISPLQLVSSHAGWARSLLRHRRHIGVAAFGYGLLHLVFYAADLGQLAAIVSEAELPGIWTGWTAFALMLAMAVISNDASQRWLRRGWKRVQRLAYPAAILTFAHWVLVHDGRDLAIAHGAALIILYLWRSLILSRKAKSNA
jgi:methionine sulfoxide reductase heme-binding subunit